MEFEFEMFRVVNDLVVVMVDKVKEIHFKTAAWGAGGVGGGE